MKEHPTPIELIGILVFFGAISLTVYVRNRSRKAKQELATKLMSNVIEFHKKTKELKWVNKNSRNG